MAKRWTYGDSWERFPIEPGEVWRERRAGSLVAVHDIYDPLPRFMFEADLLFIDPPWNAGNLNSFYTKAGIPTYRDFGSFLDVLLGWVGEIGPRACYIEMGHQHAAQVMERLPFSCRQRWDVTYYRKHPCVILRGSDDGPTGLDMTGMDEAKCIEVVTAREDYACAGDLCMGRGLVGLGAYRAGRRFVGTELNKRRLACLLDRVAALGGEWERR